MISSAAFEDSVEPARRSHLPEEGLQYWPGQSAFPASHHGFSSWGSLGDTPLHQPGRSGADTSGQLYSFDFESEFGLEPAQVSSVQRATVGEAFDARELEVPIPSATGQSAATSEDWDLLLAEPHAADPRFAMLATWEVESYDAGLALGSPELRFLA